MAHADGSPPGGDITNSFTRDVDLAKPAIVRIITVLGGHLTVHFSNGQTVTFPQTDPRGYPLGLSGTGTFISAHGDILTADHVVNPPHDSSLDQYLDETAAQDVANYYDQKVNPGSPLSSDQVTQELESGQLPSTTQYDTPSSEAYLSTDYTGQLNATDAQNLPAFVHSPVDRIEAQSSFNDKDVAIIHVSNMDDMPSVPIGDSTTVSEQDELRIIGFPGNGDVNMNNISQLLTSSVNQVFVSSFKTTDTGAPVIQVGGNVEHGDSGGPALNSNGQIVGIVSFGTNSPGSTSFLQASASAEQLVQSLGLNTTPGTFEKAWLQAFTDYASTAAGHWHKAQQEFAKIAANYPNFKAIAPYVAYTTTQAQHEKVPQSQATPQPSHANGTGLNNAQNTMWILLGAAALLLLALFLAFVVVQRRGSKPRLSTPASATGTAATSLNGVPTTGDHEGPFPLPTSLPPLQRQAQNNLAPPGQAAYGAPSGPNDALTAFGAPPAAPWPNQAAGAAPTQSQYQTWAAAPRSAGQTNSAISGTNNNSGVLVTWPCGHMNRPVARFCSVCGEPAPASRPTMKKYEQ